MKRKLIKQGKNALTITLPAKWVEKNNLKGGDKINLEIENDTKINIITHPINQKNKSVNIQISSKESFMERTIFYNYILGYDTIKLEYNNIEIIEKIEKVCKELIGFEIISQTPNISILKNISIENKDQFDIIFRRFFLIVKLQSETLVDYCNQKDKKLLKLIISNELLSNKYSYYLRRLLIKLKPFDVPQSHNLFVYLWALEQISDSYRNIAKNIIEKNTELNNLIIKDTTKLMSKFYEIYYQNKNQKNIFEFRKKYKKLKIDLEKNTNYNSQNIYHIIILLEHMSTLLNITN
jgi:phosphate uptake regulator